MKINVYDDKSCWQKKKQAAEAKQNLKKNSSKNELHLIYVI